MNTTETNELREPSDIRELTVVELDAVSGGKVNHSDLVIIKVVDKSSPALF